APERGTESAGHPASTPVSADAAVPITERREPAAPRVAPAHPVAFGRYRVNTTLGAGGFGTVYLGHDTQLDRPVAIKVLRGGPDVSPAKAERFLQEARRLARLSHPGIVTVHDVGLEG